AVVLLEHGLFVRRLDHSPLVCDTFGGCTGQGAPAALTVWPHTGPFAGEFVERLIVTTSAPNQPFGPLEDGDIGFGVSHYCRTTAFCRRPTGRVAEQCIKMFAPLVERGGRDTEQCRSLFQAVVHGFPLPLLAAIAGSPGSMP